MNFFCCYIIFCKQDVCKNCCSLKDYQTIKLQDSLICIILSFFLNHFDSWHTDMHLKKKKIDFIVFIRRGHVHLDMYIYLKSG